MCEHTTATTGIPKEHRSDEIWSIMHRSVQRRQLPLKYLWKKSPCYVTCCLEAGVSPNKFISGWICNTAGHTVTTNVHHVETVFSIVNTYISRQRPQKLSTECNFMAHSKYGYSFNDVAPELNVLNDIRSWHQTTVSEMSVQQTRQAKVITLIHFLCAVHKKFWWSFISSMYVFQCFPLDQLLYLTIQPGQSGHIFSSIFSFHFSLEFSTDCQALWLLSSRDVSKQILTVRVIQGILQ